MPSRELSTIGIGWQLCAYFPHQGGAEEGKHAVLIESTSFNPQTLNSIEFQSRQTIRAVSISAASDEHAAS